MLSAECSNRRTTRLFSAVSFTPKAVQPKIRPHLRDCRQQAFDGRYVALALADRPDAHPHALRQASAIHLQMSNVVHRREPLQDGQKWKRGRAGEQTIQFRNQLVVALDREALVIKGRQPGLCEHERLAHVILASRDFDLNDAINPEAVKLSSIDSDGFGVSTVFG